MRFAFVNITSHFYPAFMRARQCINQLLPLSWRNMPPDRAPDIPSAPPTPVPVHQPPSRSHTPRRVATRPIGPARKAKITFTSISGLHFADSGHDLHGIVDALTGASLQGAFGLMQCSRCKAIYQEQSFQFIWEENHGRCVACLCTVITRANLSHAPQSEGHAPTPPLHPHPHIVMPASYHGFDGRVVTIEGTVVDVLTSRGGQQHALMFECASWSKGLKLVMSSRLMYRIGDHKTLRGLRDKSVCVRGLLRNHPFLGPQIIASGPEAIIWVR